MYRDDYKPKEICNDCLLKLNDFYNFISVCHGTNEKFETVLFEYEDAHKRWEGKGYSTQKNGVIVPSKGEGDGLGDCSDIIMMVQCKDNNFLPLETFETFNEQDVLLNVVEQSYVKKNQTVLRHSGDLRDSEQANYYNDQMHKTYYCSTQNIGSAPVVSTVENAIFESTTYDYNVTNASVRKKNDKILIPVDEICKSVKIAAVEKTTKLKSTQKKKSEKLHSCSICNKKFCKKTSLNVHMARHTNVRPYTCYLCSKSFAVQWELSSHQKIHTAAHKCQFCPKTFTVQSKLQRHERTHTNERPFTCTFDDCNKSFSDKRNLTAHEITHSGVRDFLCDVCNKSYKTRCHLNDHKRAHEKASFKCEICGAVYKWKANLLMHMKKHKGYLCLNCKKDCGKLSVLVKHRKLCENRKK